MTPRPRGRGREARGDGDAPPRPGLALSVGRRHVEVAFDDGATGRCEIAPSLFDPELPEVRPVVAGDRVRVARDRGRDVVTATLPRAGLLARSRGRGEQGIVANLDQVVVVGAAAEPRFRPRLVDRMIVATERARFEPVVVINKIDRAKDRARFEAAVARYAAIGLRALLTSATTGEGVEALRDLLRGRKSAAAGPSGVGKSSLLNAVDPALAVRTAPISDRWGKGVHTTTGTTLHRLSFGGYYADTPGVRAFGLEGVAATDVAMSFREFRAFIDACRFNSCTHDHEPACAVRDAAAAGKIAPERYESYLRIVRGDDDEEDEEGDGAGEDDDAPTA